MTSCMMTPRFRIAAHPAPMIVDEPFALVLG
jgi:hypothetical protein